MTSPIVSIIVPVYNTSQYLDECLDSLVHQTLRDIEIICINDASTDNSIDILRFWEEKDDRIKVINLSENKMLGAVRNIGVKEAKGEFLGFLDSDDYVSYDYYQSLINVSKMGVDVVTARITKSIDETTERQLFQFNSSVNLSDQRSIKSSIAAYGCRLCASIIRRNYFVENHFQFLEGVFFEDNPIVQCVFLLADCIAVIDNRASFWFYRINPSSIVHSNFSERKFMDRLYTTKQMLFNFRKYKLLEKYKDEFDYHFFMLFYYNTIYLLLYGTKNYQPSYVRRVYREYHQIVGDFPRSVYMQDVVDLGVYKIIGKCPIIGNIYRQKEKNMIYKHLIAITRRVSK